MQSSRVLAVLISSTNTGSLRIFAASTPPCINTCTSRHSIRRVRRIRRICRIRRIRRRARLALVGHCASCAQGTCRRPHTRLMPSAPRPIAASVTSCHPPFPGHSIPPADNSQPSLVCNPSVSFRATSFVPCVSSQPLSSSSGTGQVGLTHVAGIVERRVNQVHERLLFHVTQRVREIHRGSVHRRPPRPEGGDPERQAACRKLQPIRRCAAERLQGKGEMRHLPRVFASGGRLSSSKLGSVPYVPQIVSPHRVSSRACASPANPREDKDSGSSKQALSLEPKRYRIHIPQASRHLLGPRQTQARALDAAHTRTSHTVRAPATFYNVRATRSGRRTRRISTVLYLDSALGQRLRC